MAFFAKIKKSSARIKETVNRELLRNRVRRPVLIFPAFLFLVPLIFRDVVILSWFVGANYVALFAASWDLLVFSGYVSFGHQSFFAMGAYTVVLMSLYSNITQWWILIPLGAFAAFLLGFAIGLPCLRWRGPFLILATMVLPSVIGTAIAMVSAAIAMAGKRPLGFRYFDPIVNTGNYLFDQTAVYYFSLLLLLASVIVLVILAYSRTGLIFVAIRDNELAADAAGIRTFKYKISCFVVSGFFAGLAGAFYVGNVSPTVSPDSVLGFGLQMNAFIASILGGIGSIVGPVGGAYIITFIDYTITTLGPWFPILPQLRYMIKSLILGALFFLIPDGIFRKLYYYIRLEVLKELG